MITANTPTKPTTSTVKFVVERKCRIASIPLTITLHEAGLQQKDCQPLQIELKNTFGKLIEVQLNDTVYSLYDKLLKP